MSTKLRVGWHREHFLSPLLQFVEKDKGETVELIECPGGTGEMQVKLKNGEIDLCIALTDALIAGLANGQTSYKIVGRYIASPLRWAIITGKDSQYNSVNDLKGTTFGISRLGSGSQVMASVLSLQQKWSEEEQPKFKVNGQFKPLRDSVNSGETSVFLWEWFTTKPYVDSGEVRFIGSVYTPWPCWHIAASPSVPSSTIKTFLASLQPYVQHFNSPEARASEDIEFVHNFFGHKKEDVAEWLQSVKWEQRLAEVKKDVVKETLAVLSKAGVIPEDAENMKLQDIVNTEVATIV
ncbi:hypothetical protein J008_05401 [Cryptococcus neoformans]|uniref:Ca3427-like PBP 2 domain-containing protein n=1 Tax=Cryptococcus neoformans (strain H99 / ATCC 208821 / CBS 10515 / FGSC 9487) TaxID=235443 RepID=J9W0B9_CRYN9|nr:hypothetical protein CNAG_04749 [Cryptococcus neoformans var. grubii H99]AUB27497.1 hypothetical protein CKF44_04749 [Cryptococcus neoformans var. grubii]OWT36568.1 hypothetical protein C362_05683 [Cryptococcus neoformans var. grubii Bt1]OWZ28443.1 hypothetical protein C347_05649 [Cryptococcus neoformans var. grubii AD2-60a]OWZ33783.1 hypothetical protein C353_05506 [Cryptococcus neoformans var. grubii AD1-83a]OWZ40390.1 hypothetical protein C343_05611 [Cryptococcus neoformans var. grubii C|eukprot:XP_012052182.1 hypothetical protein CNAG_04749 [Cryptococcus neoformans var. grubii H99]